MVGDNPEKWSKGFLIYVGIVSAMFSQQHPTIAAAMLSFHNHIIDLAAINGWPKSVSRLAFFFHTSRIDSFEPDGFFDFEAWKITPAVLAEYGLS